MFLQNAETGALYAAGFLSQAPTDSSTVLLPLYADSVAVDGAFDYTVATQGRAGGVDTVDAVATYDASAPAISNGDSVTVKRWEARACRWRSMRTRSPRRTRSEPCSSFWTTVQALKRHCWSSSSSRTE